MPAHYDQRQPILPQLEELFEDRSRFVKGFPGFIFTFGSLDDAIRIQAGQIDPDDLRPCRQYGLKPEMPLLDSSVFDDGTVNRLAYQRFRWAGIGGTSVAAFGQPYAIPGHSHDSKLDNCLFLVEPLFADDLFVIDCAAGAEHPAKRGPSGEPSHESRRRIARTLLPLIRYRGQFAQPAILIARELYFYELKYLKKLK